MQKWQHNLTYVLTTTHCILQLVSLQHRVRPRFFDQFGHQTTNASIGNKYFSLNSVIVRLIKIMNRGDRNWAHS